MCVAYLTVRVSDKPKAYYQNISNFSHMPTDVETSEQLTKPHSAPKDLNVLPGQFSQQLM